MGPTGIKELENVPRLIPEISYDIISRIIPGAVVIGCTLWLLQADTTNLTHELLPGLFLIILAYAVGFVIDAVTSSFGECIMIEYSWSIFLEAYGYKNKKGCFKWIKEKFEFKIIKTCLGVGKNREAAEKQRRFLEQIEDKIVSIKTSLGFDENFEPAENKKRFLEKLREHVVTNHRYATSMMPKLNAEAHLPKNLMLSFIIVLILFLYFKHFNWTCRDWEFLRPLMPLWGMVEVGLYYTAKYRLKRVIKRTVYWWEELQLKKPE